MRNWYVAILLLQFSGEQPGLNLYCKTRMKNLKMMNKKKRSESHQECTSLSACELALDFAKYLKEPGILGQLRAAYEELQASMM